MFEELNKRREAVAANIAKSFENDIEKARSGIYEDTPENRRLNRVGQKYGSKKKEEEPAGKSKSGGESGSYERHAKQASDSAPKSLQDHAAVTDSKKLMRAANDEHADPKLREAANKELVKRGEQTNANKENNEELSQARSTLKQMVDDEDLAYKFFIWDRGLYDESEVSKDEEAAFENLNKNIHWDYGKHFEWTDGEEADEYKMKMERKGFTVIDVGAGSDSYEFILFKTKKIKK